MNFKTTLLILIVFVLLAGAYFLFWQPNPDAKRLEADQQRIREVYELDKDKIRQIRLTFRDESYQPLTLVKNVDGQWQLTAPLTANANEPKVYEMLNDFLEKKVKRTLDTTDLAEYGLQPPTIQIELWLDGESPAKTFLVGNRTVNYSVYTKEKLETHVFLIESSALDDLTKSPSDFRSRDIFQFSRDTAIELSIQAPGRAEIHCRNHNAGEWKMTQPVSARADACEIEAILSALDALKAVAFEADGQIELTKYGLDPPRMTVTLQFSDNGAQLLKIGGKASTVGRIYVERPEHRAVYAVNEEIHAKLNRTVFDLRDKRVIDLQRTATNRFEIRQGETKIVCQKNVKGEWEIKSPIVLKADEAAVDDLLFGVDSLKAVEFVADESKSLEPYGLQDPSIQVSFMVPGAGTAVLLVGKVKGNHVYVKSQSASAVFLVKQDLLDLVGMGVAGLRDKQIFDFNSDDAAKVVLRHGEVHLACQKQGTNWRLTYPVQEDAKNGAVNGIIHQMNQLRAEKFLAPNTTTTGFDTPIVQLTVTLKNGTAHTLQIGKRANDKHHYARVHHSPDTIFLLKVELTEKLRRTVEDLRAILDEA